MSVTAASLPKPGSHTHDKGTIVFNRTEMFSQNKTLPVIISNRNGVCVVLRVTGQKWSVC